MNALLLVSALALATSVAAVDGKNETDICGGSACPSFSVPRQHSEGVEERVYTSPFTLASYNGVSQCMPFNYAMSQGYYHLTMYTRGRFNAESKPVSMGVPVLVEVKHVLDPEPRCTSLYTTSFYVAGNSTSLPKPKNPEVSVREMTVTHFYTYSFGGAVDNAQDRALELRQKLNALKLCYDKNLYFVAFYNSPSSNLNRRNEVWIPHRSSCA